MAYIRVERNFLPLAWSHFEKMRFPNWTVDFFLVSQLKISQLFDLKRRFSNTEGLMYFENVANCPKFDGITR